MDDELFLKIWKWHAQKSLKTCFQINGPNDFDNIRAKEGLTVPLRL